MEALGLVSNIIAVIGAARSASNALGQVINIQSTPAQIFQLANAVSDLEIILITVNEAFKNLKNEESNIIGIGRVLQSAKQAEAVLEDLNKLLQTYLALNRNGPTPIRYLLRRELIKERKRIARLSSELRDIRQRISADLTVLSAAEVRHLRTGLREITVSSRETNFALQAYHLETHAGLEILSRNIRSPSLSTNQSRLESSSPKPPGVCDILNGTSPYLRFRTSSFKSKASCAGLCLCQCHKVSWLKSSNFLQGVIGSLFVGYSGLSTPFLTRPCSERMCRGGEAFRIKVTYYFPLWFLWRSIILRNSYEPSGLKISVRTSRLVEDNADVLFFAVDGKLDEMRALFTNRQASPFDINYVTGDSPMHLAIRGMHWDMCRFLLAENADMEHEDHSLGSSIDVVWMLLLKTGSAWVKTNLEDVFSKYLDRAHLQTRNFTILHLIVLGLSTNIDLESQLQVSTVDIDKQCSIGRTPLNWAVSRGDQNAVSTLLKFRASIYVADDRGFTPLHSSIDGNDPLLTKELLDTAITSCVADCAAEHNLPNQDNSPYCKSAAAYANLSDGPVRESAIALKLVTVAHAQVLIDYGADINQKGVHGSTPLIYAIQFNKHDMLRFCLRNGARTDVKLDNGIGILLAAALMGDAETIRILNAANLEGVDRDTKFEGMGPLECFDLTRPRMVIEDEATKEACREALVELLESLERDDSAFVAGFVTDETTVESTQAEDDADEDEFFEATSYISGTY